MTELLDCLLHLQRPRGRAAATSNGRVSSGTYLQGGIYGIIISRDHLPPTAAIAADGQRMDASDLLSARVGAARQQPYSDLTTVLQFFLQVVEVAFSKSVL